MWTLRARCLSLQWKRSAVWRTRWRVEEEGVAEVWVSEEHGCYKKTCPWSARSSCSEKTAVLVLQNLSGWLMHLGFLYPVPALTTTSALCSSLQVSMFIHHREQEKIFQLVCVMVKECVLDIPSSLMMVSQFWEEKCASLCLENLIPSKINFCTYLEFIRWFCNHVIPTTHWFSEELLCHNNIDKGPETQTIFLPKTTQLVIVKHRTPT